jgi:hypothetical protein
LVEKQDEGNEKVNSLLKEGFVQSFVVSERGGGGG